MVKSTGTAAPAGASLPGACPWPGDDPLYQAYHDQEWGVPCHDARQLFELLLLEGQQAGLSWRLILHRRAAMRQRLGGFAPEYLAALKPEQQQRLLEDPAMIRHRGKIAALVTNARAWLSLCEREDPVAFLWRFVDPSDRRQPRINHFQSLGEVPARTDTSKALSRTLKGLGFSFVGETICYSFLQAAGLVNDHLTGCPRHLACQQPGVEPCVIDSLPG
jgi:DNA-3-methyladenine glycosylase I